MLFFTTKAAGRGSPGTPALTTTAPSVSIVMPTYNQAEYLPEALDGVLRQSLRDFELIVVNDGSTDGTSQILADWQAAHGFAVITQCNQKLPSALNTGLRAARGRYLTWTSSDNVMKPRMLERLVDALNRDADVGLVYADWEIIDDRSRTLGAVETFDYSRLLLMRVNYINACFMYRRECQDAVGLYDPAFLHAEDWEYWWRIAQRFRLRRVPETLYRYRVHGESLTATDVLSRPGGRSAGYERLAARFRRQRVRWALSKLMLECRRARRARNGFDPLSALVSGLGSSAVDALSIAGEDLAWALSLVS